MPSGITAAIYDDKGETLRSYLMRVGRMMGYSIMQRDDNMNVPPKFVPLDYSDRSEQEARQELEELLALDPSEYDSRAKAAYESALANWQESHDEKEALRDRYEAMRDEVLTWDCDPLMETTRENALKYLDESIKFDCYDDTKYKPVLETGEEWFATRLEMAQRRLTNTLKGKIEEEKTNKERKEYIDAFYRSLPEE